MPIITTQRRMAEQGRIRLGAKITGTRKDGSTYTRPGKLDRFRFTSPSQRLIEAIATQYGGDARPWDNDGKAEYEVLSEATAIPVIVVKGGFSQWHEFWTKGGCQHRCDGEKDAAGTYCDPQDPNHLAAIEKPTTRLSVMLSEIESLGVWRMESKGWNAAAELPSMAELAMHVGDLVPATLGLAERSSIIQTDRGPQTSRYVVPFLDLHVTKQRLVEIVGGPGAAPAAIEGGSAPALEAPKPTPGGSQAEPKSAPADVHIPTPEQIADADLDTARRMVAYLEGNVGEHPATVAARARVAALEPQPDEDGAVDAELVPDEQTAPTEENADAVWQQVLAVGGQQGMSLGDVEDDFSARMGGLLSSDASAGELRHYLGLLQGGTGAAA